jgi:hypothetical protein
MFLVNPTWTEACCGSQYALTPPPLLFPPPKTIPCKFFKFSFFINSSPLWNTTRRKLPRSRLISHPTVSTPVATLVNFRHSTVCFWIFGFASGLFLSPLILTKHHYPNEAFLVNQMNHVRPVSFAIPSEKSTRPPDLVCISPKEWHKERVCVFRVLVLGVVGWWTASLQTPPAGSPLIAEKAL